MTFVRLAMGRRARRLGEHRLPVVQVGEERDRHVEVGSRGRVLRRLRAIAGTAKATRWAAPA